MRYSNTKEAALPSGGVADLQPLGTVKQRLHDQIRRAFDPDLLFNPGQFYGASQ